MRTSCQRESRLTDRGAWHVGVRARCVGRGVLAIGLAGLGGGRAWGQAAASGAVGSGAGTTPSCTTQAKMTPALREALAGSALHLGQLVQAGDEAQVRAATAPEVAANFAATAALVRSTAPNLAGEQLAVTQLYALDATGRKPGEMSEAEFSCPLTGSTNETDFAIAGLPTGRFAFAMVEASGEHPWLLALLLEQGAGGEWQLAGFFPRRREAAGHDGLWYWRQAQEAVQDKHPLLAWLLFGEADELLRPANFVSSTHLDQLRAERRAAAPPELSEGISAQTPLVVQADGSKVHLTGLAAQSSDDGKELILAVHLLPPALDPTAPAPTAAAQQAFNQAAAHTLLAAHPDLRSAFGRVLLIAEAAGQPPVVTDMAMIQVR